MRTRSLPLSAVAVVLGTLCCTGVAGATFSAASRTRSPLPVPHWTKISSDVGLGYASAGLFRTPDGRLHVIWPDDVNNSYSLHYSTVGPDSKLIASGTVVNHWGSMTQFPQLIPGPHRELRVIFNGANGKRESPYNDGTVYAATSSATGMAWTLLAGSLSHTQFVPLTDDAATAETNGQPIAAWASGASLSYHVGLDHSIPAKSPDKQIPVGPDGAVIEPTLVTDPSGTVWGAWFNSSGTSTMGYWADPILTGKSALKKAPGSGGKHLNNSQPLQPVALAAHRGGGNYLAYCLPTTTISCNHVALWRVGAAAAAIVPSSGGGQSGKVAIAAGPGGHMWVAWFDYHSNVIHVVRTNAAVTRFGEVETVHPPAHFSSFYGLQAESSSGPLDLVALVQSTSPGSSAAFFDIELLPPLQIGASKTSVSSTKRTTISFKVADVGDPVAGATVSFLGKVEKTTAHGVVQFTIPKGTRTGKREAVASRAGYTSARITIRVT